MSRNRDIFLQVRNVLNEKFGSVQGEYVDLGLPSGTLWATCNLGAKEPWQSGLYFAWGETTGYSAEQIGDAKQFSEEDYEHTNGDNSIHDSYGNLKPQSDAATIGLDDEWRMPTRDEIKELLELEDKWINNYNGTGMGGVLLVGYNGKTLFLPAAGYADDGQLYSVGSFGHYWTSSLYEHNKQNAYGLNFSERGGDCFGNDRFRGFSVRPVRG